MNPKEERFAELLRQYGPGLGRIAASYARPADQDDLRQEISIAIWNALDRFRGDCSFAALRTLPVPQRQVLTLALEGMALAEIGACVGITADTAAVRLSRARAALRERLRDVAATAIRREGP